ncbi:Urb1p [Sugiyamaella lignohabitans]|uniref:Urb1p n=1 Tax=Sugiyamaella lignohabitans TaxID=796027 RepID=A0A167DSP6_9ASCO|nr:Urb1p [Sugiyamaella lignohabitans]ANB13248.1 Urb1p [Sugiyamaella lignohabitans]
MIDQKEQSNQIVQDKILSLILGSNSPRDALLLDIVKRIEGNLGTSWNNRVFSSQFQSSNNKVDDYERQPTFIHTKDGFEVSLDIEIIKASVQSFHPMANFTVEENLSLDEIQTKMASFSNLYPTDIVYNSEFLLMCLASSTEIFKDNGSVDLKAFVESYGMSFVLCCLSSEAPSGYLKSARSILAAVAFYLSEESDKSSSYREKLVIKLLVSKVLNFFSSSNQDFDKYLPSCVCTMMALTLPVMTNPGHYLNEKAVDFLLSTPSLRATELPMFSAITKTSSENAIREIQWLFENLTYSLSTQKDVALYMQKGVFEYALSVKELSSSIKIEPLILKTQEAIGGSMSLVTRNGALSWTINELSYSKEDSDRAYLFRKLGSRFVASSDSQKLNEWTDDAIAEFIMGLKA